MQLENKKVLVLGLGLSGVAASRFLARSGASVCAVDDCDTEQLRQEAARLRGIGVEVRLGCVAAPEKPFDFVVTSPGVPWSNPVLAAMVERSVPIIGELELGAEQSLCLNIAITGTNGKTTTTELIERLLLDNQLRTIAAGNIGRPICSVVDQTRELDFLTLEVSSFQLETICSFRPVVGVLLNITPDHLDRYSNMADYVRAKGRLFENQQPFDWAVIQSEALALLRAQKVNIPSKIITFSATDQSADIHLDRGLLISRMGGWAGPLLNMDDCLLRGPHNAENLMAALAVGRIIHVPLERMIETLKSYKPAPHRCEVVAEIDGVTFINDSKATNVDAVAKALMSMPPGPNAAPNVWLIAGGKDKGLDYHDLGPLLAQRAKGAFLIGEAREKISSAWSLFISCTRVGSLLEAVQQAADSAVAGDIILLSPACASFDQFRNYQHRGEVFREAVRKLRNEARVSSPVRTPVRKENGSVALMM